MTNVDIDQTSLAPGPTPAERRPRTIVGRLRRVLDTYGIVLALLLLAGLVSTRSDTFLTVQNLGNLLGQWAPAGVMAVGMTVVILVGGLDLSIGAGYSLCAIAAAVVGEHSGLGAGVAAAVAVGVAIGVVNAILVVVTKIPPFIATLGVSFVLTGLAYVLTNSKPVNVLDEQFTLLGLGKWHELPWSGLLLIAVLGLAMAVLSGTVFGRWVYAAGGNPTAATLAGIPTRAVVASSYVLSGVTVGLGGSIVASQIGSAQPNINPSIVFDVITIVVLGGTSLSGGSGAMWRTGVGIALLATIDNGITLLNLNPNYKDIVKGVIIIGALAVDGVARSRGGQRRVAKGRGNQ
jgi:ribose transport system permease protein